MCLLWCCTSPRWSRWLHRRDTCSGRLTQRRARQGSRKPERSNRVRHQLHHQLPRWRSHQLRCPQPPKRSHRSKNNLNPCNRSNHCCVAEPFGCIFAARSGKAAPAATNNPSNGHHWKGAGVVELERLESVCTAQTVPRVRIPPFPLNTQAR